MEVPAEVDRSREAAQAEAELSEEALEEEAQSEAEVVQAEVVQAVEAEAAVEEQPIHSRTTSPSRAPPALHLQLQRPLPPGPSRTSVRRQSHLVRQASPRRELSVRPWEPS